MNYCRWLDGLLKGQLPLGYTMRLPTEAEWEKAARGTDGRTWPWGDTFDKDKCNSSESDRGSTTPVGLYSPRGDSPYGCADMAGNVCEWTHSRYKLYPYRAGDGREFEKVSIARVLRGGSFNRYRWSVRCAYRDWGDLNFIDWDRGFRVAVSPILNRSPESTNNETPP
jgi:formylglycine-generating enzyme required for sulfatase activity